MKQCPACNTTYTDDSLRFCLADGASLNDMSNSEATVLSPKFDAVKVDIGGDQPVPIKPKQAGPPIVKFALVLGLLALILVGSATVAGLILYYNTSGRDKPVANTNISIASPSPTATPDTEKQRLADQLANIQKRLDEQQNTNRPANVQPPAAPAQPGVVTAKVNSPKDGFLALRTEPDPEFGERVAKIPHGATVTIENCARSKVTIDSRSGRWCMVTYGGQTGYVFDAWLIY